VSESALDADRVLLAGEWRVNMQHGLDLAVMTVSGQTQLVVDEGN